MQAIETDYHGPEKMKVRFIMGWNSTNRNREQFAFSCNGPWPATRSLKTLKIFQCIHYK
jgi:hypothetical protein